MKVAADDGVDYAIGSNGALEIQYNKIYGYIRMLLPESIDLAECVGFSIKMNGKQQYMDLLFFDKTILSDPYCVESSARWGILVDGQHEYQCFPVESGEIYGIGFMVGTEDADYSDYKFTIDSVTFHMASGNNTIIPKDIAPDVTEEMSLLNTYGTVIDNIGTMLAMEFLENPATLKEIKEDYNSVSMGYHLDYPFNDPVEFMSVEEAKKIGYFIPDDYADAVVPKIDFTNWDKLLKLCAENNLKLRGQINTCGAGSLNNSKWFFSEGYKDSGAYVTPEKMDARNEFFYRTIMEYVYNSEYSHVVYAWDLPNEYFNTKEGEWVQVYGTYSLTPDNVKRIYEAAADVLERHGVRDTVSLVLNEYNTYMVFEEVNIPETLIAIADYINSDTRAVDAIGMQGHIDSETSVAAFKNAMKKYLAAGYEVQVTEMDVSLTEQSEQQVANQTKVYSQVLKDILALKKSGADISLISIGGASDLSAVAPEYSANLFKLWGRPRECYYGILQAYAETINNPPYTPPQVAANGDLTYTFRDMDHLKLEGYAKEPQFIVLEDGALEIPFAYQYHGLSLGLPEGVDMSQCTGVTFKVKTDACNLAVCLSTERKLFDHWADSIYTDYGCHGEGIFEYTITPNIADYVHSITLMILNEMDKNTEYKATFYSVTFHMKPGYQKE